MFSRGYIYIYISMTIYLSSSVPSSSQTTMNGRVVYTKQDQIISNLWCRPKLVLIPSFWGNTPNYFQSWNQRSRSPRLGMNLRSPAYMKIISSKERPLSLRTMAWSYPPKKISEMKGGKPLVIHEGRLDCLSVHRWRENPMALAVVPFSMVTRTALVFHSLSKGYNWNLTQKPFPNTASLG